MVLVLVAEQHRVDQRTAGEIEAAWREDVEAVAARIVTELIAEQRIEQQRRARRGKLPALVAEKRHLEHRRRDAGLIRSGGRW